MSALIAAVIAATVAIVLAIIGATWKVSSRLGDIRTEAGILGERVTGIAADVAELKHKIERRLDG